MEMPERLCPLSEGLPLPSSCHTPSLLPLASAEKVLFPCSAVVSNRPLATSPCRAACNVLGSSCPLGESQERHLLLLDT